MSLYNKNTPNWYQDIKYCPYCGTGIEGKFITYKNTIIFTRICPKCGKYKDPVV